MAKRLLLVLVFLLVLIPLLSYPLPSPAQQQAPAAEDKPDAIEAVIQLLKEKGIITEEEAAKVIERNRRQAAAAAAKAPVITITPGPGAGGGEQPQGAEAAEQAKKEVEKLREDLDTAKEEINKRAESTDSKVEALEKKVNQDLVLKTARSSWAERIRWGGDIRLRYQGDYYGNNNAVLAQPGNPTQILNTTHNNSREIYRVRLALNADLLDEGDSNVGKVEVGIMVTTGNENNPVTTNSTLGDYYNNDKIVLNQGYLKWTYKPHETLWGRAPQVSLTGGRMPNPFFSTNLVWDSDLSFEGAVFQLQTDTLPTNPWRAFLALGAFPLQNVEFSSNDKWLYGGQLGFQYNQPLGLSAKFAVSYYDYINIVGQPNDPLSPGEKDYTAPLFQQKGNTLMDIDPGSGIKTALASDFRELDFVGLLDYSYWDPIHIQLLGDYVINLGFDQSAVSRRAGVHVPTENYGYQVGLTVGYPETLYFGDWNLSFTYRYLQADAVVDAFTDSDFHGGGTNCKGWILGGNLGLYKNVWLGARWMTSDQISGPPLAIDTLQVDLNARF